MRRTHWFAPMTALLLLLSACGGDPQAEWQRWQEELRAAQEIGFQAEITSQTDADTLTFSADVLCREDTVTMTLREPETLRGLQVVTRQEGTELRVEELTVSLTAGRGETLAPGEAGAILWAALREGYILYTGTEGDLRRAAFTGPREETVTLWRDAEGRPTAAALGRGDRTELSMSISDWQIKE